MISKLHQDTINILKNIFPGNIFLYEYPYSKFVSDKAHPYIKGIAQRINADIYDKTLRIVYEVQGLQHYAPVGFFGGLEEFDLQQIRDDYKRMILQEAFVSLVEIPYNFKLTKENLLKLIKEAR